MIKKLVILGDREPSLWVLLRIIRKHRKGPIEIYFPESRQIFEKEKIMGTPREILVLINAVGNIPAQVNKWVWKELRLNDRKIGREMAGVAAIVLGQDEKFLETPEGKVFRDFPLHHKYLIKPIDLHKFLAALENVYPINPYSLCVVKGDAPENLIGALEHDLANILQKFNFEGSDDEVKKRFHKVEIDLDNYSKLAKNKKRLARLKKEVKRLKEEIIKRKGEIWQ